MKIYRYISTIKSKEPTGQQPTHYLVGKTEQTGEKGEFVAALWAKEYKNPAGDVVKFLSGEMKAQWTDQSNPEKSRKGFVIVEEAELNKLLKQTTKAEPSPVEAEPEDEIPF